MTLDAMMRRLAEEQHGVVATAQVRHLGATRSGRRHRVARADWVALSPRVLRLAGSVATPKQQLMAAVLDAGAGAVVSHEAAAALWGVPGFWMGSLDVSRPRTCTRVRPNLGELHESRRLAPDHVTACDGIPVTSVARTLFDLAGAPGLSAWRVERAVDNAISLSPPVLPRLHALLGDLASRGRPGITLMRELLDERPVGYVAPASGLEARVIGLLDEAGIATRRQVDLGGDEWIGRVDLLVADAPVVVEADSAIHHTSVGDRRRDHDRDEALAAIGLRVVRVTDEEAFCRPWLVGAKVRAALGRSW
ncbi:MAG: DUF559 domain-containing protein [Acidimicrobiales bacterium]